MDCETERILNYELLAQSGLNLLRAVQHFRQNVRQF